MYSIRYFLCVSTCSIQCYVCCNSLYCTTPNIDSESCFDLLEKAALFGEAIGDGDNRLERLQTFQRNNLDWLYQTKSIPQRQITKLVKMFAAISSVRWKMRQPLRQQRIAKPWQQQKQQSEHAWTGAQASHILKTSSNQTRHSQKPRNRKVAASCNPLPKDTSIELASLKWNSVMHCIFDIV